MYAKYRFDSQRVQLLILVFFSVFEFRSSFPTADSDGNLFNSTNVLIHKIHTRQIIFDSSSSENIKRGCGETVDYRIVGGRIAYRWPWMVALRTSGRNSKGTTTMYKCGGVLISDQHVLTAAHCVQDAVRVDVQLGHHLYFRNDKSSFNPNALVTKSTKVFVHENYQPGSLQNDIALIKLERPVPLGENIWPICLPLGNPNLDGMYLIVAGWGKKRHGMDKSSDELLEVDVPVWTQDVCRKLEAPYSFNGETQICAGPKEGGEGFCQGDSGGPLMYQSVTGEWSVVGIVSSSYGCAAVNRPGIYSRVSLYTNWIARKLQF